MQQIQEIMGGHTFGSVYSPAFVLLFSLAFVHVQQRLFSVSSFAALWGDAPVRYVPQYSLEQQYIQYIQRILRITQILQQYLYRLWRFRQTHLSELSFLIAENYFVSEDKGLRNSILPCNKTLYTYWVKKYIVRVNLQCFLFYTQKIEKYIIV